MTPTFSKKIDFFGASSSALRLISSRAGYSRHVIETAGICVLNSREISGDFIYPVCQYSVTQNTTLQFTLGHAYTYGNFGFFLTSVSVRTSVCNFPLITFMGTANEGENAIKQHAISVSISARSKAQNIGNAFTLPNGCHLNECEATWSAEPVVVFNPYETNGTTGIKAVASDIQHGRIVATCITVLGAPSAASGWELTNAADPSGYDSAYEIHEASAVKSLT